MAINTQFGEVSQFFNFLCLNCTFQTSITYLTYLASVQSFSKVCRANKASLSLSFVFYVFASPSSPTILVSLSDKSPGAGLSLAHPFLSYKAQKKRSNFLLQVVLVKHYLLNLTTRSGTMHHPELFTYNSQHFIESRSPELFSGKFLKQRCDAGVLREQNDYLQSQARNPSYPQTCVQIVEFQSIKRKLDKVRITILSFVCQN